MKKYLFLLLITLMPTMLMAQAAGGAIKRQNKENVGKSHKPHQQNNKPSRPVSSTKTTMSNGQPSMKTGSQLSSAEMLQKGYDYRYGTNGMTQCDEDAFSWFKKAAENGSAQAKTELALYYTWGKGCSQNKEKGKSLLNEAAEAGNADAMYWIGSAYLVSHIDDDWNQFPHDANMSFHWMMKAAEHGHGKACISVGLHYSELGDIENTKFWMKKALDNGYRNAQKYLDQIESNGKITTVGF